MASAASARVHPACINAGNPYHECSEYCFRRIADGRVAGREGDASAAGKFPNFVGEGFNFFCKQRAEFMEKIENQLYYIYVLQYPICESILLEVPCP